MGICKVSENTKNGGEMDKLLLKPMEAAEAIGVGRSRIYEMLTTGEMPSVRIGRSIRVPVRALNQWVEDRQSNPNLTDDD